VTEEEVRDILEKISELGSFLGWKYVLVQNTSGQLLGMTLGSEDWLQYREGKIPQEETH